MTPAIKKTIITMVVTMILGLTGNYVKNKFSVFSDDLGATRVLAEENKKVNEALKQAQDEMKKYVELNVKLQEDKIKLNKKYMDDIARINNERFDKITLYSKPGNNVIIHSGLFDVYQNVSSNSNSKPNK